MTTSVDGGELIRGMGGGGLNRQPREDSILQPRVISGLTTQNNKAKHIKQNPRLSPGDRGHPVLPSTLGSYGFPPRKQPS